ncbi:MAG: decaprenyl-phosphate phosphoribosyltransferase, partial [Frankia sp.]
FRPVASGLIPVRLAWMAGVSLVAGSIAVGGLTTNGKLAAVLAGYVALTLSYSLWLKHIAIIELMAVAGGFLLRPMAGAAATDVPVSRWFIIVASFGSLYMVVGKRYAEVTELGDGAANHRRILSAYPAEYLRQTRELAAGVTLLAYCLWAFERAPSSGPPWSQLSIIPITFGLLRYALLLEKGQGGAPEEVVLRDRQLLVTGLIWVLLFGLSAAKVGT